MEDGDGQPQFVGQLLEFNFPQAHARAVASAAVGGDRQGLSVRVAITPHADPPGADRVDGEGCGIVVDPDADPPFIIGDIINTVGRGATELRVDEIMDADRLGGSGRPVFTSAILIVTD